MLSVSKNQKSIMEREKKTTETTEETKADNYDKEKDASIEKQEPSTKGDLKSGNQVLLEEGETD